MLRAMPTNDNVSFGRYARQEPTKASVQTRVVSVERKRCDTAFASSIR